MITRIIITFTLVFLTHSVQALVQDDTSAQEHEAPAAAVTVLPEYVFSPSTKLESQVESTLALAKNEQKLALFVLGAQWCHDSKALAKNFSTPQMQQVLSANYQVLFVDVGYLENGFELVKQFNQPIYYGTPTVMVVNPDTKQLLNKLSMKKWLNAYKVPLEEYVNHFADLAENRELPAIKSETMQTYLQDINHFEQQQAIRLKKAYQVVGPLLKAYMKSDAKKASEEFVNKWQPVQDFRYSIQDDIKTLIAQAKRNVEQGSNQALDYPTYPKFIWEK